ncbi:hypothetical protein [Agrobacterium tumefaciens]|uniref:hypothetical protein n=1 Tax=Agrobacterium tumefaciens TaxID=358 RepID=UPI0021FAEB17|nr:hypothetical protein FY128_17040 [Agrobacterium tumefaciens]
MSGWRVKQGDYTEADVSALYMKYRESGLGPFTREVGDFIAHSKRNRGATLDLTAYMFSQLAFFQTYQGDNKQRLQPNGDCGWWLRHYFLTKAKDAKQKDIRRACGLTKKQAIAAIKSWFDSESSYPTTIKCNDPILLYRLASLFSQKIDGKNAFDLAEAKSELGKMFSQEGIARTEIERFLVATAVLLSGKSVEIVPGFTASVELVVQNTRYVPVENGMEGEIPESRSVKFLPDGSLSLIVSTENKTGDGLVSVVFPFLDTEIDTETYFSRSLVVEDPHGFPRLALDQQLWFDASAQHPVFKVS